MFSHPHFHRIYQLRRWAVLRCLSVLVLSSLPGVVVAADWLPAITHTSDPLFDGPPPDHVRQWFPVWKPGVIWDRRGPVLPDGSSPVWYPSDRVAAPATVNNGNDRDGNWMAPRISEAVTLVGYEDTPGPLLWVNIPGAGTPTAGAEFEVDFGEGAISRVTVQGARAWYPVPVSVATGRVALRVRHFAGDGSLHGSYWSSWFRSSLPGDIWCRVQAMSGRRGSREIEIRYSIARNVNVGPMRWLFRRF